MLQTYVHVVYCSGINLDKHILVKLCCVAKSENIIGL